MSSSSPVKIVQKNNSELNININFNNEENSNLNQKRIPESNTASDFFPLEPKKQLKHTLSLRPVVTNKKIYNGKQKNNEINSSDFNSDLFNVQNKGDIRKVPSSVSYGDRPNRPIEESLGKCHNYFIGFQFMNDDKKKKKNKKGRMDEDKKTNLIGNKSPKVKKGTIESKKTK